MKKLLVSAIRRALRRRPITLQQRFPEFEIGVGSYGEPVVNRFTPSDLLYVGKYCSFAKEVHILLGGEHRSDWVTTFPFSRTASEFSGYTGHPKSKGPVRIENDVWVGYRATILSGVTIGSGAVVGAGSVVTRSVPSYAIVAGSPAKVIGYRFDANTRETLLAIAWWDWPHDKIAEAMPLLLNSDIAAFIARYKGGKG
ncbi:MAG: CatB-related O-acetyltransferase [Planctomycetota bacterium]